MSNRPQFTVRDLLIWTTILAVGTVLLMQIYDLENFRLISGVAENVMLFPASIVYPFGLIGFIVAPVGMLVMLAVVMSEEGRSFSNGLFLVVTTICWVTFIADGDTRVNTCLLMLVVMFVSSAICFIEAYYRTRNDDPEVNRVATRLFTSSIASVVIVVATNLFWGTAIFISQF